MTTQIVEKLPDQVVLDYWSTRGSPSYHCDKPVTSSCRL